MWKTSNTRRMTTMKDYTGLGTAGKEGVMIFRWTTGKYQWRGLMRDEKSTVVDEKRKWRPLCSGYLR